LVPEDYEEEYKDAEEGVEEEDGGGRGEEKGKKKVQPFESLISREVYIAYF
jgi:hypothetical protein